MKNRIQQWEEKRDKSRGEKDQGKGRVSCKVV